MSVKSVMLYRERLDLGYLRHRHHSVIRMLLVGYSCKAPEEAPPRYLKLIEVLC